MNKFARQVVEQEATAVRAQFDEALGAELSAVYDAVDGALDAEMAEDGKLRSWPAEDQKQRAACLAIFRKAINDILGSVEALRSGYADLCQGSLRSSLEAFATAILVNENKDLLKQYFDGQLSVNKNLGRFAQNVDYVSASDGQQFLGVYNRLHKMTHPTALAMALQFSPEQPGGFPIGGAFYSGRLGFYREVVGEMKSLADNITGYLRERYPSARVAKPLT